MPGTPPAVRHYVSDCLHERHPYDAQKGFAGARARDAGRVYDGFMPGTLDTLQRILTDTQSSHEQRARAAHRLHAHSASQEVKIDLIQRDVASGVVAVLTDLLSSSRSGCALGGEVADDALVLEQACFSLLRSLCVLPQGCDAVVQSGGVECVLQSLQWVEAEDRCPDDTPAGAAAPPPSPSSCCCRLSLIGKRHNARTAAANVLHRLSRHLADDAESLESASAAPRGARVMVAIACVLDHDAADSSVCGPCVAALEEWTRGSAGLRLAVSNAPLMDALARLAVGLTARLNPADTPLLPPSVPPLLPSLLNVIWNIAMDGAGAEAWGRRGVGAVLFDLLDRCTAWPGAGLAPIPRPPERARVAAMQRALLGALSALHKLTAMKRASVQPLGAHPTRVHALLAYVRTLNALVDDEARAAAGGEGCGDVAAMSTNAVQCIRLASEVREVRDGTHRYLAEVGSVRPTEAFYLRRQLYFSTKWEEEYDAHV